MSPRIAACLAALSFAGLGLTACHVSHSTHEAPRASNRAIHDRHEPRAPRDADGFRRDLRSGTMTAGYFDDGDDPSRFAKWANDVGAAGPGYGFIQGFEQPAIQFNVINEHGDPVSNAKVVVGHGRHNRRIAMRSGTDGRCVLLPDYDELGREMFDLSVYINDIMIDHQRVRAVAGDTVDIEVRGASASLPEKLDLALVIDTTGSMGDELEYLKVEFRAIVERIEERLPHVDQRWAIVVYRDKGDTYVVRDYDFTSSLSRVIDRLGDQRADGGGDYPEAVHTALEETKSLRWRDDAAKVAFLIADAPPHANRVADAMLSAQVMRAEGIALYPVASSGVKAEAEHFFRAAALLTGGGYSFLTDDSGVGNTHAEPHAAPAYDIKHLDDLIVQLVESELMGEVRPSRQRDIIREVPDDDLQQRGPSQAQIEQWRVRRDKLTNLLRTTELSPDTTKAIRAEIDMLDRRIASPSQP